MRLKDLKGVVILLFFALITAFFYNHFSPFGIPLWGQWSPSKENISPRVLLESDSKAFGGKTDEN
jgi:hypothetical protein